MNQVILHTIKNLGGRCAMVPIEKLEDIKKNIVELKGHEDFTEITDLIVNVFYNFSIPSSDYPIRSILIVARPTQLIPLYFQWEGQRISVMNEPIKTNKQMQTEICLNTNLNPEGYHVNKTDGLPLKMMAVRSGLSEYGRNNITYITDLGSFYELEAYYTDVPCDEFIWRGLCRMEQCDSCTACINTCPTKAISAGRQIIDVSRCMTYLNEFIDLCEFPNWLTPSAHNCLHGCMKCQLGCPMNHHVNKESMDYIEFTEDETRILMEGASEIDLTCSLREKIERLDLMEYLHLLPRNLMVLFDKKGVIPK